jgi:hypothetical protein
MDELEVTDADSQKVAAMLRALPRADAPANFEFRVKAGIANGSPSRFAVLPFLRTAAPVALTALAVSFGVLYYERPMGTETGPINNMAMSGSILTPAQTEPVATPSSNVVIPARESSPAQTERAKVDSPRNSVMRRTTATSSSHNREQGGSVDRIIHPANVIMPPGFESANPQNRNANTAATSSTDTPVREVLGMFGIEGDFADGGLKVRSVKENGLGARVKIVAGDVIESIDGQPVKNDTKLKGGLKTLTVRRSGKVITLSGN